MGVVKCDVLHEVSVDKIEEEGEDGVIEEAIEAKFEKKILVIKAKTRKLEMGISQMKIAKSIVKVNVKK